MQIPDIAEGERHPIYRSPRARGFQGAAGRAAAAPGPGDRRPARSAPPARCVRPEIVSLMQSFASQSALAIQNARLFQEIEENPAARTGEPAQVAVPGQHEPRAPDAAQCHPRLYRAHAGRPVRRASGQDDGGAGQSAEERQAPAWTDQRRSRSRQDRSGAARARHRGLLDARRCPHGGISDRVPGCSQKAAPQGRVFQGHAPGARATSAALRRFFSILSGNAIKFTDAGEVRIAAKAANGKFRWPLSIRVRVFRTRSKRVFSMSSIR